MIGDRADGDFELAQALYRADVIGLDISAPVDDDDKARTVTITCPCGGSLSFPRWPLLPALTARRVARFVMAHAGWRDE